MVLTKLRSFRLQRDINQGEALNTFQLLENLVEFWTEASKHNLCLYSHILPSLSETNVYCVMCQRLIKTLKYSYKFIIYIHSCTCVSNVRVIVFVFKVEPVFFLGSQWWDLSPTLRRYAIPTHQLGLLAVDELSREWWPSSHMWISEDPPSNVYLYLYL